MNMSNPVKQPRHTLLIVLFIIVFLGGLGLIGFTGYFRLSAETAALQRSLLKSASGHWNKTIAVNIGPITMAVVRNAFRFVRMEVEPRTAIESLRSAEVGVYKSAVGGVRVDRGAAEIAADKAMKSKGWERAVSVSHGNDWIMVYFPRKTMASKTVKCCFLVLHDDLLVVGGAGVNSGPILALATLEKKWPHHGFSSLFTTR
jgi:hypothetical protein